MSCAVNSTLAGNHHLKTFERVHNYPIVSDSFVFALSYYHWAKSKNIILDVALNKLEGALKTVKDKTEPIAAEKFHYLDETVCHQLERFEKLCPIILQPSKTITSIPTNIYHQRIEPSIHRVVQPVTYTLDMVTKTSFAAAYMMSSTLSSVVPTSILSGDATIAVLNKTEQLLDRFLPKQDDEFDKNCQNPNEDGVYRKIKHLSAKTRHRIFKKIVIDIDHFRKASLEKLEQIYSIIQEIKNSKSSVCKETVTKSERSSRYDYMIREGVQYLDHLQNIITTTGKSMPKLLCSNTMSILDILNEKLFVVRNTIQDSTNRNLLSEKRINQAADSIDFVRSWIEYFTDNLKEYYSKYEKVESEECVIDEDDFQEASSIEDNSDNEEETNHQQHQ